MLWKLVFTDYKDSRFFAFDLQSAASGTLLLTAANLANLAAIHPPTVTAPKQMDTASVASSTHFTVVNGLGRPANVYRKSWCARNQLTVLVCTMSFLFMVGLLAGILYMESEYLQQSSRCCANSYCHTDCVSTPRAISADSSSTNLLTGVYLWLQWGLATSTTRPRGDGRNKRRRDTWMMIVVIEADSKQKRSWRRTWQKGGKDETGKKEK